MILKENRFPPKKGLFRTIKNKIVIERIFELIFGAVPVGINGSSRVEEDVSWRGDGGIVVHIKRSGASY